MIQPALMITRPTEPADASFLVALMQAWLATKPLVEPVAPSSWDANQAKLLIGNPKEASWVAVEGTKIVGLASVVHSVRPAKIPFIAIAPTLPSAAQSEALALLCRAIAEYLFKLGVKEFIFRYPADSPTGATVKGWPFTNSEETHPVKRGYLRLTGDVAELRACLARIA